MTSTVNHQLEEYHLRYPFHRYMELFQDSDYAFLLDSAGGQKELGHYSYVGGDPFLVYRAKRVPTEAGPALAQVTETLYKDNRGKSLITPKESSRTVDLFSDLRRTFSKYQFSPHKYESRDAPFFSGAIGYFGYETGHFVEALTSISVDDLQMDDVTLLFCDCLFVYNHKSNITWISAIGRGETQAEALAISQEKKQVFIERVREFERSLEKRVSASEKKSLKPKPLAVNQPFSKERYCNSVAAAKEHILAGDALEICLTHRMDAPFEGDTWRLYQELRRLNPAPFASYLKLPEATIVSSSPERFLKLSSDRTVQSRPIKGTRPRGKDTQEDNAQFLDLSTNPKDKAENMMIVDLVRNDLGMVCQFGSVRVPELLNVEKYATVFQLVSTIEGKLRENKDVFDLISAAIPGGSMTGAPKIEAMKIIDTLEPVNRGVYSGAIGFLDFTGTADLNIVIRTIIITNKRAYLSVGGAIVADSEPDKEYDETMDKARALIEALNNCHREYSP